MPKDNEVFCLSYLFKKVDMFYLCGALCTSIWGKSGNPTVHVYNNIFISNGTVNPNAVSNLVWTDAKGTFYFNNNLWFRVEGGLRLQWSRGQLSPLGQAGKSRVSMHKVTTPTH